MITILIISHLPGAKLSGNCLWTRTRTLSGIPVDWTGVWVDSSVMVTIGHVMKVTKVLCLDLYVNLHYFTSGIFPVWFFDSPSSWPVRSSPTRRISRIPGDNIEMTLWLSLKFSFFVFLFNRQISALYLLTRLSLQIIFLEALKGVGTSKETHRVLY